MKKLVFFIGLLSLFVLIISTVLFNGRSPGAKTGSPADISSCTQCHGGDLVYVDNWITSNIPNDGYIPGNTYEITVTGTHTEVSKFGFESTCEDAQNLKVGVISVINSTETKLTNNDNAITHKSGGGTGAANTKSWSFNWTAPISGTGDITFYAAINAANSDNTTSGDVIYGSGITCSEQSSSVNTQPINKLTIYPNPTKDFLIVSAVSSIESSVKCEIFNTEGKKIKSLMVNIYKDNNLNIDVKDLPAGNYLLEIASKPVVKEKFVILK